MNRTQLLTCDWVSEGEDEGLAGGEGGLSRVSGK